MAEIDYEALARELIKTAGQRTVEKTTGAATAKYGHGTGGLFSFPGLEPDVVNALVLPKMGLLELVPSRTSTSDNPMYGIMTGVTDETGSEPATPCDDPPSAGFMKLCEHTFSWGHMTRQTATIDLTRLGHFRNRSDFNDLYMVGGANLGQPTNPDLGTSWTQALRTEKDKVIQELAVAWARLFPKLVFSGNPTNNNAGGGYKEPYGLNILINTGYRDAETGTVCPAADSIVRSWGSLTVNSTNATSLVRNVTNMRRNLKFIADRAGLSPVDWVIAMPWSLFYEITEVWPQAYHTYRNTVTDANQTLYVEATRISEMRDEMRDGSYLLIDGVRVPVVTDDGIAETDDGNGKFTSSLYFVPLKALGRPVTWLEFFDYSAANAAQGAVPDFLRGGPVWTTNGGRFLWTTPPMNNFCVKFMGTTDWRLILLTPHIAGRLTNICYVPLQQQRNWDPDAASYYVNGGKQNRDGYDASFYAPNTGNGT